MLRRIRFGWGGNLRPILILVVLFAASRFLPMGSPERSEGDWLAESLQMGWSAAVDSDDLAVDIERRINDERRARGLPILVWHDDLAVLAREWSEEMIRSGYRHSSDGFRQHQAFRATGENIAVGQSNTSELHIGWMESDGHRANILRAEFTHVGVGIVCRNDGRMWATQIFGVAVSAQPLAPASSGVPPVEPIARRDNGMRC